jgi:hypothetical protein
MLLDSFCEGGFAIRTSLAFFIAEKAVAANALKQELKPSRDIVS